MPKVSLECFLNLKIKNNIKKKNQSLLCFYIFFVGYVNKMSVLFSFTAPNKTVLSSTYTIRERRSRYAGSYDFCRLTAFLKAAFGRDLANVKTEHHSELSHLT